MPALGIGITSTVVVIVGVPEFARHVKKPSAFAGCHLLSKSLHRALLTRIIVSTA
ncbi:hypothetical protein O9992_01095 [Vibrio lentus]|nr:hypothetical protein [Vibrio lentus]